MKQADFTALIQGMVRDCEAILVGKGHEYAGSDDRLANFKRGAAHTGVEPLTVLFVYMSKHWDSISTYVKAIQAGKKPVLSEPIRGRFADLINYSMLAVALIEERTMEEVELAKAREFINNNTPPLPGRDVPLTRDRFAEEPIIAAAEG